MKKSFLCSIFLASVALVLVGFADASSKGSGYNSSRPSTSSSGSRDVYTSTARSYPLAIKGYDPVAYFEAGKALKGKSSISYPYQGQKYYFANKTNESLFLKNPKKYAPQYLGYCAYAVSQGAIAKASPKIWSIVDGKLYLNVNKGVKQRWEANKENFIRSADQKWPALEQKL